MAPLSLNAQNHARGEQASTYLIAGDKGKVTLLLNKTNGSDPAAVSYLALGPTAEVPIHLHENSSEYLYVTQGEVMMTIGDQSFTAKAGDAIYIPAGAKHSARVGAVGMFEAVQIYVGPGPEQRFTLGKKYN